MVSVRSYFKNTKLRGEMKGYLCAVVSSNICWAVFYIVYQSLLSISSKSRYVSSAVLPVRAFRKTNAENGLEVMFYIKPKDLKQNVLNLK